MKLKGKKRYIVIVLILAIAGSVYYFNAKNKNKVQYTTVEATQQRLVQTVTETGTIKTASELSLNFLAQGKISKINAKIGDRVIKDQILAELDYSNLKIQQKQATANLDVTRANLSKVKNGAAVQDVTVSQASVRQAESAYRSAQSNLDKVQKTTAEAIAQAQKNLSDLQSGDKSATTFGQAVVTAQTNFDNTKKTFGQAIESRKNSLFNTLENQISVAQTALDAANRVLTDDNLKDTLSIQDPKQGVNAKAAYAAAIDLIPEAKAKLAAAQASRSLASIDTASQKSSLLLNQSLGALNDTFSALIRSVATVKFPQSSLDGYKSSISGQVTLLNNGIQSADNSKQALDDSVLSYNTNISAAQNNLDQAQSAFSNALTNAKNAFSNAKLSSDQQVNAAKGQTDSAYNAWQLALAQYNRVVSPARAEDLSLAEAQVAQAQASLESITNQINNNVIKAPIDGEVTQVNYDPGEEPSVAKPVIALLSRNNLEIDLDISETDIVKVSQGDAAVVTFDALGEAQKFSADVVFIEPAQTVIQGVVYYKTKVSNLKVLDNDGQPLADQFQQTSSSTNPAVPSIKNPLSLIRPGMTANVTITTEVKDNSLAVPSRAILSNAAGNKIVRLLQNNQSVEVPVVLGLRADEGLTEIVSGIKAGDRIITAIKNGSN